MTAINFTIVPTTDSVFGTQPVIKLCFDTPLHGLLIEGKPVSHMRTAVYFKVATAFMKAYIADKVALQLARHYATHLGNPQNRGLIPLNQERAFQQGLKANFGENFLMVQNLGYVR